MSKLNASHAVANEAVRPATPHDYGISLLSLPGELRNMIWGYALVENHAVVITSAAEIMPPLTRVCRQTHQEASFIYLSKNRFKIQVFDYDAALWFHFTNVADRFLPEDPDVDMYRAMTSFSAVNTPAAVQTRKANYLDWTQKVWKCREAFPREVWDAEDDVASGDWRDFRYRWVKLENTVVRLQAEGIPWEQAQKLLVLAIDMAGICKEENLE